MSLVLGSSIIGRLLMGWLADRFAKKHVMLLIYAIVSLSILLLYSSTTPTAIYVFAVLFGIGLGGDYMIIPLMAAELFGVKVMALHHTAEEHNYQFSILKSVMSVNEKQKISIIKKITDHFNGDLKGKKVALWGLAFKPDTDDIREAPSLYIIEELLKLGAQVIAYDPEAMKNVKTILGDKISYGKDPYEILSGADMLLIATEWSVFRTPEFEKIEKSLRNKLIFDGRNLYDLQQMKDLGFTYYTDPGYPG